VGALSNIVEIDYRPDDVWALLTDLFNRVA